MLRFVRFGGGLVRPGWSSVEELDRAMVERWNSVVGAQDHVYHMGDVTMERGGGFPPVLQMVKALQGHKRLLLGNHDHFSVSQYQSAGFEKIFSCRVFDRILFTHIPIHPECMARFRGNAHGHIHANASPGPKYLNLSVENIDYTPKSLEWVSGEFAKREKEGQA